MILNLAKTTGVPRENPQGGGVYIHHFLLRLAEINTPLKEKIMKKRFFKEKPGGGVFIHFQM